MKAEHLTQLSQEVRRTLEVLGEQYRREDDKVEQAMLAAARQVRLKARAPVMCEILIELHQNLSLRDVFEAVSLKLGLHQRTVEKIYYAGRENVSGEG